MKVSGVDFQAYLPVYPVFFALTISLFFNFMSYLIDVSILCPWTAVAYASGVTISQRWV